MSGYHVVVGVECGLPVLRGQRTVSDLVGIHGFSYAEGLWCQVGEATADHSGPAGVVDLRPPGACRAQSLSQGSIDRLDPLVGGQVVDVREKGVGGQRIVALDDSLGEVLGGSACVSVPISGETLGGGKVEDTDLGGSTLLAVSIVHGAEGLVALEFDDAGHVVGLETLLEDGRVCEGVDLPALDLVVAGDGDVAVGEELAEGGRGPGVEAEQLGVSRGALDVQFFGGAPEVSEDSALGGGAEFCDGVDLVVGAGQGGRVGDKECFGGVQVGDGCYSFDGSVVIEIDSTTLRTLVSSIIDKKIPFGHLVKLLCCCKLVNYISIRKNNIFMFIHMSMRETGSNICSMFDPHCSSPIHSFCNFTFK